jgi:hypothetical protein
MLTGPERRFEVPLLCVQIIQFCIGKEFLQLGHERVCIIISEGKLLRLQANELLVSLSGVRKSTKFETCFLFDEGDPGNTALLKVYTIDEAPLHRGPRASGCCCSGTLAN